MLSIYCRDSRLDVYCQTDQVRSPPGNIIGESLARGREEKIDNHWKSSNVFREKKERGMAMDGEMTILVVDDDPNTVQMIEDSIPWESYGIGASQKGI